LQRLSGFIEPCLPSKVARPPSGPLWVHEIKHDGYRLMVRRDGLRVRCFTRNGHDWADRFPAIVDAAHRIKASSFLIDGEAVIARDDGTPDFRAPPRGGAALSRIAQLDQRTALPDQCLHSAEAEGPMVQFRTKSGCSCCPVWTDGSWNVRQVPRARKEDRALSQAGLLDQ
jgi:ATP dependent DNA ligase domain